MINPGGAWIYEDEPKIRYGMDEKSIREEMWRLRHQIEDGDNSEILAWIIPDELACSQRPLRDHPKYGGRNPLPPEARPLVVRWVDCVKQADIRSIICMLEDDQLEKYYEREGLNLHENGLIGYYESRGLQAKHFPQPDYQKPDEKAAKEIYASFSELPKPVLLHCSAAIDRTSPVAAYIVQQEKLG